MPSGVRQASASTSPPGAERAAAARQAASASGSSAEGEVKAAQQRCATIIAAPAATIASMPRPVISLVAVVARDGGIGRDGGLLVRLPDDLRRFKQITLGTPVVMGRKTWQSIGRPLPGRRNIVLTRDPALRVEGAEAAASFDAALALAAPAPLVHVIGGAEIYALAL